MKNNLRLLILAVALTLITSLNANATIIGETIHWAGTCLDCDPAPSPAHAHLGVDILDGHPGGTDIGGGNLNSFWYFSNIFPLGIGAGPGDILFASGVIPPDLNTMTDVIIEFFPFFGYSDGAVGCFECGVETAVFTSDSAGIWELSIGGIPFDVGVDGVFNPTPEPASVALLGLGLLGLRARRRQAR